MSEGGARPADRFERGPGGTDNARVATRPGREWGTGSIRWAGLFGFPEHTRRTPAGTRTLPRSTVRIVDGAAFAVTGGALRSWAVRQQGDRGPTRDLPRPGPVGLTEPWSIPTASGYPHRALAAPGGGPAAGAPRPSWPESRGTAAGLSRTIRRHQRKRDGSGGEALRRVVTDTEPKGHRTVGWGISRTRTSRGSRQLS